MTITAGAPNGAKLDVSPRMPFRSRSSTSTPSSSKVARAYCFSVEFDPLRDDLVGLYRSAEQLDSVSARLFVLEGKELLVVGARRRRRRENAVEVDRRADPIDDEEGEATREVGRRRRPTARRRSRRNAAGADPRGPSSWRVDATGSAGRHHCRCRSDRARSRRRSCSPRRRTKRRGPAVGSGRNGGGSGRCVALRRRRPLDRSPRTVMCHTPHLALAQSISFS